MIKRKPSGLDPAENIHSLLGHARFIPSQILAPSRKLGLAAVEAPESKTIGSWLKVAHPIGEAGDLTPISSLPPIAHNAGFFFPFIPTSKVVQETGVTQVLCWSHSSVQS